MLQKVMVLMLFYPIWANNWSYPFLVRGEIIYFANLLFTFHMKIMRLLKLYFLNYLQHHTESSFSRTERNGTSHFQKQGVSTLFDVIIMLNKEQSDGIRRTVRYESWNAAIATRYNGKMALIEERIVNKLAHLHISIVPESYRSVSQLSYQIGLLFPLDYSLFSTIIISDSS